MADLVQDPASVMPGTPAQAEDGLAGQAINAGETIYRSAADNKWYPASAAGPTADNAGKYGLTIALNSAPGANQPVKLFRTGRIKLGATLAVGETYGISANAGQIAPVGDLVTGNFVSLLGVAIDADFLETPTGGAYVSNTAKG